MSEIFEEYLRKESEKEKDEEKFETFLKNLNDFSNEIDNEKQEIDNEKQEERQYFESLMLCQSCGCINRKKGFNENDCICKECAKLLFIY